MEAASRIREAGIGDGAPGALVGELFREHARTVYGLCLVLLRNAHEAEDAAQAAFVSAYESVCRGTVPERPHAWLLTIARNECLDRLRRRSARPETPLEEDLPSAGVEEIAARNATITELRAALNELPANQRDAIVLHELGGLGYTQVAETLGVSVSAVESLLFRARQRLRERTDTLRVLGGLLILPVGLREGLAKAIPGFPAAHSSEVVAGTQTGASGAAGGGGSAAGGAAGGSATMSGGTLGTISVKLASLPLVAKVAASVVVVAGAASAVAHEVGNPPPTRALSAFVAPVALAGQSDVSVDGGSPAPTALGEPPAEEAEKAPIEDITPAGSDDGGALPGDSPEAHATRPQTPGSSERSADEPTAGGPLEGEPDLAGDPPTDEPPASVPPVAGREPIGRRVFG